MCVCAAMCRVCVESLMNVHGLVGKLACWHDCLFILLSFVCFSHESASCCLSDLLDFVYPHEFAEFSEELVRPSIGTHFYRFEHKFRLFQASLLINSEEEAAIALQVSNAITQTLLRYRMGSRN